MKSDMPPWMIMMLSDRCKFRAIASSNSKHKITKRLVREYQRKYLLVLKKLDELREIGKTLGDPSVTSDEFTKFRSFFEKATMGSVPAMCKFYLTHPKSPLKDFVDNELNFMDIKEESAKSTDLKTLEIHGSLIKEFNKLGITISANQARTFKKQIKYLVEKWNPTPRGEDKKFREVFKKALVRKKRSEKSTLPKGK